MEQSTGLFDGSSDTFLIAMASLIGMLGVAVIVGLISIRYSFLRKTKVKLLLCLRETE